MNIEITDNTFAALLRFFDRVASDTRTLPTLRDMAKTYHRLFSVLPNAECQRTPDGKPCEVCGFVK